MRNNLISSGCPVTKVFERKLAFEIKCGCRTTWPTPRHTRNDVGVHPTTTTLNTNSGTLSIKDSKKKYNFRYFEIAMRLRKSERKKKKLAESV